MNPRSACFPGCEWRQASQHDHTCLYRAGCPLLMPGEDRADKRRERGSVGSISLRRELHRVRSRNRRDEARQFRPAGRLLGLSPVGGLRARHEGWGWHCSTTGTARRYPLASKFWTVVPTSVSMTDAPRKSRRPVLGRHGQYGSSAQDTATPTRVDPRGWHDPVHRRRYALQCGAAFNADGTVFRHADTPSHALRGYDVDPASSALSHRRIVHQFEQGKVARMEACSTPRVATGAPCSTADVSYGSPAGENPPDCRPAGQPPDHDRLWRRGLAHSLM